MPPNPTALHRAGVSVRPRRVLLPARTPADALPSLQGQAYEPATDSAAVPPGEASSPTYIGAGSLLPFVPLPGRGGARNRKERVQTPSR